MFSHEGMGKHWRFVEQMLPLATKPHKFAAVGQMHMDAHCKVKRGEWSRLGPLK